MDNDLKWIKKHYGEEMMHMCREMFPKILEKEGVLSNILKEHFPFNRHLARDIKQQEKIGEFKNYIFSFIDVKNNPTASKQEKTAKQLLDEAGYILYPECKTEKEIQSFKKYYKKDEELCTFRGGRLDSCRVWFAVKKDVENIKRQNFKNPQRQDEYGTSVISIQFSKYDSSLSIKNRYNHTVTNPDNTFNSNLDNIILGLTDAFYNDFDVKDTQNSNNSFSLENYVKVGEKYYSYNYEMNNIYYCNNNIIIDNFKVIQLPNSQMLVDTYIIDFQNKTISLYDDYFEDSTPETITNIKKISYSNKVITIEKEDNTKVEIEINDKHQIVSYTDESLTTCKDDFLNGSKGLIQLNLPALKYCGEFFAYNCESLQELNLPSLEKCDNYFLSNNKKLKHLSLPSLKYCSDKFISKNECLQELNLPALQKCGSQFLEYNTELKQLNLPALKKCRNEFLKYNTDLKELNLPELQECGSEFLAQNTDLKQLYLAALKYCGNFFAYNCVSLQELNLPSLEKCDNYFLSNNKKLKHLSLPSLKYCGDYFLEYNTDLQNLNLPKLQECGSQFLEYNTDLKQVYLHSLQMCGDEFMYYNTDLQNLSLPKLQKCGDNFIFDNKSLKELDLPALKDCGNCFLYSNIKLKQLNLPELLMCGDDFMKNNTVLQKVNLPSLCIRGNNFLHKYKKQKKEDILSR